MVQSVFQPAMMRLILWLIIAQDGALTDSQLRGLQIYGRNVHLFHAKA